MLVEFFWNLYESTCARLIGEVLSTDSGGMVVKVVSSLEKDDCLTRQFLDKVLKIDFSDAIPKEFGHTISVGDTVISTTDSSWLRKNKIYKVESISDGKAVIKNMNDSLIHNVPQSYLRKVNL